MLIGLLEKEQPTELTAEGMVLLLWVIDLCPFLWHSTHSFVFTQISRNIMLLMSCDILHRCFGLYVRRKHMCTFIFRLARVKRVPKDIT